VFRQSGKIVTIRATFYDPKLIQYRRGFLNKFQDLLRMDSSSNGNDIPTENKYKFELIAFGDDVFRIRSTDGMYLSVYFQPNGRPLLRFISPQQLALITGDPNYITRFDFQEYKTQSTSGNYIIAVGPQMSVPLSAGISVSGEPFHYEVEAWPSATYQTWFKVTTPQSNADDVFYDPQTPTRFGIGSNILGLVGKEPTNFGFTAYDRLTAATQVKILRNMRQFPLIIDFISARSPGATYGDQSTIRMAGIMGRTNPTGVIFREPINAEAITSEAAPDFAYRLYQSVTALVPDIRASVYVFYLEGNHFRNSKAIAKAIQYKRIFMILMTARASDFPLTFQHELAHILNYSLGKGLQDDIYPNPDGPEHSIRTRNILNVSTPPGNSGYLFTPGQQVKFYMSPLLRREFA